MIRRARWLLLDRARMIVSRMFKALIGDIVIGRGDHGRERAVSPYARVTFVRLLWTSHEITPVALSFDAAERHHLDTNSISAYNICRDFESTPRTMAASVIS
jgi:hypothetical protein